jgi:type VI secretion system protein
MEQPRLLERIRKLESGSKNSTDDELTASITAHLHKLLSTRCGTVPISNDYGMPSIDSTQGISFQEYLRILSDAIADQIRRFEPRLANVTLHQLSNKDELLRHRFGIRAHLASDPDSIFECELTLSPDSKVSIITDLKH